MKQFAEDYPVFNDFLDGFGWLVAPLLLIGAVLLAGACFPLLILVGVIWVASHIFAYPWL